MELRNLVSASGVRALAELYRVAYEARDIEKQKRIEQASPPILREIVSEPNEHGRKRAAQTGRTNASGDDVAIAVNLLASFEHAKAERLPREIKAADAALAEIKKLFGELCGYSPRFLSREGFASAYLTAGRESPHDFDISPGWPMRFTTDEYQIPGWSSAKYGSVR